MTTTLENRTTHWEIHKVAKDVLAALVDRIKYRDERIAFWQRQLDIAEDKLRSEGVTLSRKFDQFGKTTTTYANSVNGNVQVHIAPDLQRAVSEADAKLREHEGVKRDMEQWLTFLSAMDPQDRLTLKFSDFLYFFRD